MSQRVENSASSLKIFEPVIGLEIHAQLKTNTKLFCGCPVQFGAPANTLVCPVCLGLPGALPVINKKAVEFAVKVAIALNMKINSISFFARKNYFYPDLPKGYQITQFKTPIAENGYLDIIIEGRKKRIGIERVTLEEDAGKMIHDAPGINEKSLIDFNRSGVPLVEIVTKPEISSPEEASEFFSLLRNILIYLGVNDGNMEEGDLRCDANVSLRELGESEFGTRTEIKNLNSFKFLKLALKYEIERQKKKILEGEMITLETRTFNPATGETVLMRGKEEAHDYRYFPEPDLPPLFVSEELIEKIREEIPELPSSRVERYIKDFGLGEDQAKTLAQSRELADYFEEVTKRTSMPKKSANWILGDVMKYINEKKIDINSYPVSPLSLSELILEVENGKIPRNIGRDYLQIMAKERKGIREIHGKNGEELMDEESLKTMIKDVIKANQKPLEEWLKGKTQVLGFFMGEVMKRSRGKADAVVVKKLIKEILDGFSNSRGDQKT